jgi:hypothetical protein
MMMKIHPLKCYGFCGHFRKSQQMMGVVKNKEISNILVPSPKTFREEQKNINMRAPEFCIVQTAFVLVQV